MPRVLRFIFALAIAGVLAAVAACSYVVLRYERAFEATNTGDDLATVLDRFGQPSVREQAGILFARYAYTACVAPCVERLWFENPALTGIEAWSIEIGAHQRVVHKAHWVSP